MNIHLESFKAFLETSKIHYIVKPKVRLSKSFDVYTQIKFKIDFEKTDQREVSVLFDKHGWFYKTESNQPAN